MSVQWTTPKQLDFLGDQNCLQRVTEIRLYGVTVSDDIAPLLKRFRKLRILDFGPTSALSSSVLADLQAELPECKIYSQHQLVRVISTPLR